MKNKKLSLNKLNLKKMTISSLQSIKGGNVDKTTPSGSMNTQFTKISDCCSITVMTGICC